MPPLFRKTASVGITYPPELSYFARRDALAEELSPSKYPVWERGQDTLSLRDPDNSRALRIDFARLVLRWEDFAEDLDAEFIKEAQQTIEHLQSLRLVSYAMINVRLVVMDAEPSFDVAQRRCRSLMGVERFPVEELGWGTADDVALSLERTEHLTRDFHRSQHKDHSVFEPRRLFQMGPVTRTEVLGLLRHSEFKGSGKGGEAIPDAALLIDEQLRLTHDGLNSKNLNRFITYAWNELTATPTRLRKKEKSHGGD